MKKNAKIEILLTKDNGIDKTHVSLQGTGMDMLTMYCALIDALKERVPIGILKSLIDIDISGLSANNQTKDIAPPKQSDGVNAENLIWIAKELSTLVRDFEMFEQAKKEYNDEENNKNNQKLS